MFVNEEIGVAAARNSDHAVVEIFDPAVDRFTIPKLDLDADLPIAQRAKVKRLLSGIAWRWSPRPA